MKEVTKNLTDHSERLSKDKMLADSVFGDGLLLRSDAVLMYLHGRGKKRMNSSIKSNVCVQANFTHEICLHDLIVL